MRHRAAVSYLALAFLGSCVGETHTAVEVVTTLTTEVTTKTETAYVFDAECTETDIETPPVTSSTESASNASPTTVLLPAVHWDQDTSSIENLHPIPAGETVALFYSEGASCGRNAPPT